VPQDTWGNNLRSSVSKSIWDAIRKTAYEEAGYKCSICGATGRLEAHEVWDYDYEKGIQKLIAIKALCKKCHMVKHMGRSMKLAAEGLFDIQELIDHFNVVNELPEEHCAPYCDVFRLHFNESKGFGRKNIPEHWTVDFGEWA
jgi:hypothetical protein